MTNKTKLPILGNLYKTINTTRVWPAFKQTRYVSYKLPRNSIIMFTSIEQVEPNSSPNSGIYNLYNFIGADGKQYQFRFHPNDIIEHYIKPLSQEYM